MKKNIIIFHTDQQRYDSLHCNGNEHAKTPNLDALASEGCRFTRHIGANPVCMPSRASFFSGQYVPGHGVYSNGIPLWTRDTGEKDKNDFISEQVFGKPVEKCVPTMADILGQNGYHTASFGKLHFQPHLADDKYNFYESYSLWEKEETEKINNPYYGFQTCKLILGHGEAPCGYNRGHYGRWLLREHPEVVDMINSGEDVNTKTGSIMDDIYKSKVPSELHNSMWIASEACEYLDTKKDDVKPVFMFLGFPDPHHPMTPPEDIATDFEDLPLPEFADYNKIKSPKPKAFDDYRKKAFATKEEIAKGYRYTQASVFLIDKAIGQVIDKLKELGIYEDTTILFTSDHGDFMGDFDMICKYDVATYNLVHLPFIMKPATKLSWNMPAIVDTPMSNVDVLPTLLAMNGINIPDQIQGIDIRTETAHTNMPMVTCSTVTGVNRNISIFDDTYRYTYYINNGEEELYNHKEDPFEYENLVTSKPEEYKKQCAKYKATLMQKHLECEPALYNHYGLW